MTNNKKVTLTLTKDEFANILYGLSYTSGNIDNRRRAGRMIRLEKKLESLATNPKHSKEELPPSTDVITIREVSSYLKLNIKTTYRLASLGIIPSFKVGGSVRFHKDSVIAFAQSKERTKT